MKTNKVLLTTALCTTLAAPAVAQRVSFADIDLNGDGKLSSEELVQAFGAEAAQVVLARQDEDGDGVLTRGEASRTQGDDTSDDDASDDTSDDDVSDDTSDDDASDDTSDDDASDDTSDDDASDDTSDDG